MWRDIKKVLLSHRHFLITTHVNPDGDGVGSSCALIELLLMMKKSVRFVCDSPISPKFLFLDFHHIYESYHPEMDLEDVEVLVMVDTHKRERIGRLAKLLERPRLKTICIDHHNQSETLTPYVAIDPHACSSGAMIYTLFKELGYDLNREAAMGLYASVICDTGRFCYSSTDRKAHKIAEECIRKGVDPDWMYSHLYRQVTLEEFRVFARALQNMEVYADRRLLVQSIRREDYKALGDHLEEILHSDLEYIHEFNKLVIGIECVALLREMPNDEIRISLRSNSSFPVDLVTKAMGGGGHSKAAGATVKGSLERVKAQLVSLVESLLATDKLSAEE